MGCCGGLRGQGIDRPAGQIMAADSGKSPRERPITLDAKIGPTGLKVAVGLISEA